MYRPTISIRAMFAVVACIGLACVALARANAIWASVMFTAALAVISLGLLAAILRRGAKQAYWIGFALFGWLYLWMAHWPAEFSSESRLQTDQNGTLASTRLLAYAYIEWLPKIRETPASTPAAPYVPGSTGYTGMPNAVGGGYGAFGGPGAGGGGMGSTLVVTTPPAVVSYPALHEFMRVGHSLFIIILAVLGGTLGNYLYQTRDRGTT
jgi:hypothetical protein